MSTYTDKIVWVTGASSGIGAETARQFSALGAKVVLSARNEEKLKAVQAGLAQPNNSKIVPLDLEDSSRFQELVDQVVSEYGRIDFLINNGGVSQRGEAGETSLDVDRRIMEINFFAVSALTKLVLPQMIEQKEGQFIAMSSLVGKFGSPLRSAYSASKHALHGYYEALRAETYEDGIRVLIVCPGFIKTNISINAVTGSGEKQNKMDDKQANGMLPEDLAKKILRGVYKNKEEIVVGGSERYGVLVKRLFPSLFSKLIKRIKVT